MNRPARSIIFSLALLFVFQTSVFAQTTYNYKISYQASGQGNPDDMAIWIHPTDKSKSTVIAADKHGQIYVYDVGSGGQAIQVIAPPGNEPGNIDVRYNFPLGGQLVDIVAHNRREGSDQIVVYKVNADRTLTRIDNNTIQTAATYGFCLYRSKSSDKLYGFTTSKSGNSQQWELVDAGGGQVDGNLVRSFNVGSQTEGCVADDEYGVVYMAEEGNALWKYNAEPDGGSTRTAVDSKSGHLTADLEGVTIYKTGNGAGYIIQSSQGASRFDVYQRQAPHAYVASFKVSGASSTDGIDVSNVAMGSVYPKGVFLAHSGGSAVRGVAWDVIAAGEGLTVDTSWDPRGGAGPTPPTATPTKTPTPTVKPGTSTPTPTRKPTPTGTYIPGDIDGNGKVDIFDYNQLVTDFGKVGNIPSDIDGNGKVDIFDYNILVTNFGRTSGTPTPTTSIIPTSTPTPSGAPCTGACNLDHAICNPDRGSSAFSTNITNQFLPFSTGMQSDHVIYNSSTKEKVRFRILSQLKDIPGADGVDPVKALVLEEFETVNDSWIETSHNWFAQTSNGTVCYFGENVFLPSAPNGGGGGSWEAGKNSAKAGIMMPPNPAVGMTWMIEDAPNDGAVEDAVVISTGQSYTTPAGTFQNVVYIEEDNHKSKKRYAPGVGMIYDDGLTLISY